MSSMVVVTLSYRPDFERFERLHKSVLAHTPDSVMHCVIVPQRDYSLFSRLSGPRLTVWPEPKLLPKGFIATGGLSALAGKIPAWPGTLRCSAVNLRHPWPPIRGWVLQQVLKFAACTAVEADSVVIIDSDVVLVRDIETGDFQRSGTIRLYENPNAITADMERHMAWTHTAHRLLGLPAPGPAPHPDYIGGIVSWDPRIVAACLERVEQVAGCSWGTAIGRELHISEFILYGTYVAHFGTQAQQGFVRPQTLCHSYWKPSPMTEQDAQDFLAAFPAGDLAVHVQSNSGTALKLVDELVNELSGR